MTPDLLPLLGGAIIAYLLMRNIVTAWLGNTPDDPGEF
jgi:hypothetical protein